jgi:hypothetical protein
MSVVEIEYKGKTRRVPKRYIPDSLSEKDKKKQIKSIFENKDRPKVKYKERRSSWVVKFEEKYGVPITDTDYIDKNILKEEGQKQIINKGMGAYYSSGSRPNQNPYSWGYGRLASVILGGKARRLDEKIWEKYKID